MKLKNWVRRIIFAISCLAVSVPVFSVQAITYAEVSGKGQVLGESTSFNPYPTGTLVNDDGTIYFISGTTKIPFTSWQAFVGLGYLGKQVVEGDLTNYTLAKNYIINSPNIEHPWGSWLIYKGTVYYSSAEGLIGVPSTQVFTSNGGDWTYIVKANSYDIANLKAKPNLPLLTVNDPRVNAQSPQLTGVITNPNPSSGPTSTPASVTPRVGQIVNVNNTLFLVALNGLYGFPSIAVFNSWGYSFSQVTMANSAEQALARAGVVPEKQAGCNAVLDQIKGVCGTPNVANTISLYATPSSLSLSSEANSQTPAVQVLINSKSTTFTDYSVAVNNGGTWLKVSGGYKGGINSEHPIYLSVVADSHGIAVGNYNGSIVVTTDSGATVTVPVSFAVSQSTSGSTEKWLSILPNSLAAAQVGQAYSAGFKFSYYKNNIVNVTVNGLPSGFKIGVVDASVSNTVSLSPSELISGVNISGTPSQAGNYTITVTATDGTYSDSKQFNLVINPSTAAMPRVGQLVNIAGITYLVGDNALLVIPDISVFNSWCFSFSEAVSANEAETALPKSGMLAARAQGQTLPQGVSKLAVTTCPAPTTGVCPVSPSSVTPIGTTNSIGTITITSPNGGECLTNGSTKTITWTSSSNIDQISILLTDNNGTGEWIAFSTANTGSYTWNVNKGNTINTQFKIKISGYQTGLGSVTDETDNYFTIN